MNIVDRYPHKRLTADYMKRHILWDRLISCDIERRTEVATEYIEPVTNRVIVTPSRINMYANLKFDITGLESREIEAILFSEYDNLEFTDPYKGHVIKLIEPSLIDYKNSIEYGHGKDYSSVINIEMIVRRIEFGEGTL